MQRLLFFLPVALLVMILFGAGDDGSEIGVAQEGVSQDDVLQNDVVQKNKPAGLTPEDGATGDAGAARVDRARPPAARLVVVVLDSLRREALEDEMPGLMALARRPDARLVDVHTCAANFTYPCLQTLFEGRQSPFVAGLHNFTGRESDARSVPSDLMARGRRVAVLSDISLVSLYGGQAAYSQNVEDWSGEHLERDLRGVEVLRDWIQDADKSFRVDDILFHLVGTDKAAHQLLPGSSGYAEHFRAVDKALAEVLSELDFSRDQLLITGDHGHNEEGHHTRESVAVFVGARYQELFEQIERSEGLEAANQKNQPNKQVNLNSENNHDNIHNISTLEQPELAYFMSYAANLPIPLHYEGRYFLQEIADASQSPAGVRAYVDLTRRTLAEAGYDTNPGLSHALAELSEDATGQYLRGLLRNLPLLFGFFFWLVVLMAAIRDETPAARHLGVHVAVAISVWVSWWLSAPSWGVALGLSAVYAAASAVWAWRFGGARRVVWLLVLMLVTAIISYHAKEWAEFFHTRGGFVPSQPIFYAGLPLVGLALAWLRDADWRQAPEAAMIFGITCLPSGVYYYQFGQNIFWGFFLSAAAVAIISLATARRLPGRISAMKGLMQRFRTPGTAAAALVLAGSAVVLLLQEAGGWIWLFFPSRWLSQAPDWVGWLVYALITVYAAALLPTLKKRLIFGVYMTLSALAAVLMGKMALELFVSAQVVLLFMASFFSIDFSHAENGRNAQLDGLVLWAAFLALSWCMTEGFFIQHVDFHFGFAYFGHMQKESMVFLAISAVTLLKYGLSACAVALFYRLRYGRAAFEAATSWLLFFGGVQLLARFVQVNFSALGSTEKLYELAISEAIFVLGILLVAALFMGIVALVDLPGARSGASKAHRAPVEKALS